MPDPLGDANLQLGPISVGLSHLVILGVTVALMLGLHLLLKRTRLGKAMRAVAENHVTAALLGVPVERTIAYTFLISGSWRAPPVRLRRSSITPSRPSSASTFFSRA